MIIYIVFDSALDRIAISSISKDKAFEDLYIDNGRETNILTLTDGRKILQEGSDLNFIDDLDEVHSWEYNTEKATSFILDKDEFR